MGTGTRRGGGSGGKRDEGSVCAVAGLPERAWAVADGRSGVSVVMDEQQEHAVVMRDGGESYGMGRVAAEGFSNLERSTE